MDHRLVAALIKIVGKSKKPHPDDILLQLNDECHDPDSDYWNELWDNEDYLRKEFDSKEDLASDGTALDDCMDIMGDSGYFFEDGKALLGKEWLVHFTEAKPTDIMSKGFFGANIDHLGLTKGGGRRLEGDYALAYDLADLDDSSFDFSSGNYGRNVILFKAGVAVKAYHKGDDEYQVIFDVRTVKPTLMLGFEEASGKYKVYDNKGKLLTTKPAKLSSLKPPAKKRAVRKA